MARRGHLPPISRKNDQKFKPIPREVFEAAGKATLARRGSEFYREIGRKGGIRSGEVRRLRAAEAEPRPKRRATRGFNLQVSHLQWIDDHAHALKVSGSEVLRAMIDILRSQGY